ncbi:MAG: pilus assembly protein TadG-related protein [Salaquimonas sp.]
MKLIKEFCGAIAGNFAITLGVAAAPLMGAMALAVDYGTIYSKSSELQSLADASALAVVKEMALANSKSIDVQSIAESYANGQFSDQKGTSLVVEATAATDRTSVDVALSYTWQPFFAHYLNASVLPLKAASKAGFTGGTSSVCILGLDDTSEFTVNIGSKSSVTANGCSLFSNSKAKNGLNTDSNATITADTIQTAGGYSGQDMNYSPFPITDALAILDPLADRAAPTVGACDYKDFSLTDDVTQTLKPGVYCNGLSIDSAAIAKLEPGEYIIKDGPLSVQGNASLIGEHVGFYFTGNTAVFDFGVSTQAVLTAPKTGNLSGILFYEDRNSMPNRVFTIRSKDAEKFEGTVYLPQGTLFIDKESRVGQLSNWTAIIVKRFEVGKGPQLMVNSDYANSDVPVPEGVAGKNSDIRLLK